MEFLRGYLELCRDMECPLLKVGGTPVWCRQAAEEAAAWGVSLASNNHAGGPLETVRGTREFLDAVDHPNFGLLYDCMHLRASGQDYVGCILELVESVKGILVQSRRRDGDEWVRAFPDEPGVQDWRGVFTAFRQAGYSGPVTVIENNWPTEQREEVARRCAETIRGFIEFRA